jgi:phosphohistidine swiveling domain-containing protein
MRSLLAEPTFSLEPSAVVNYVRQLILEDHWRQALEILTKETTPSLEYTEAIAILSGEQDIVEDGSQFNLAEQDKDDPMYQRWVRNMEYMKSGILAHEGLFYRPYGVIVGFNREDEQSVLDYFAATEMSMTRDQYRQARAQFYAKHVPGGIVCFVKGTDPVIFKPVSDPPFWTPAFTDPAKALADFNAKCGRGLEEFGETFKPSKSDTYQFYIKGVVHGAVRRGGDYSLPDEDEYLLQDLITARGELDEEIDQLDSSQPRLKGVYRVDKKMLLESFHEQAYLTMYRTRIHAQAEKTGGFINLVADYPDGPRTVLVPSAPFLHWVRRNSEKEFKQGAVPEWKTICPESLKMPNDSSMHSDWWIGAGLTVEDYNQRDRHPVDLAAWAYAMQFARDNDQNCIKLAGSGRVSGAVVFPGPNEGVPAGSIAVVPSAGPAYEIALLSACKGGAGAVIAAVGGKLAHLAIVSREMGARLVVMEGAMQALKPGQIVTVDFDKGIIETTGSAIEDRLTKGK